MTPHLKNRSTVAASVTASRIVSASGAVTRPWSGLAPIAVAGTTGPSSASSRQPWLSRIGTLAFFAPGLILLGWAQALRPPAPRAESAAAVLGIPEPLSYSVRGVRAVIGPWTVLACCAFWLAVVLALAE